MIPRHLWRRLRDAWSVIEPRPRTIALGLILVALNRAAGLVQPTATKYLIDEVIGHHRLNVLPPILVSAFAAVLLQGFTAVSLTQVLARASLDATAQLRKRLHWHVVRLATAYYDANKTGALISRIMTDVEGTRALLGVGLITFVGALLTALGGMLLLFRVSVAMSVVTTAAVVAFGSALARAFGRFRPAFRRRPEIMGEVTGRLNETLNGIRVVKAYRAEAGEHGVFASGVQRLLDNGVQTATATARIALTGDVFTGLMGVLVMLIGTWEIQSRHLPIGSYVMYTMLVGMLMSPVAQIVSLAPELLEALVALERARDLLALPLESSDGARTKRLPRLRGAITFTDVSFAYRDDARVLSDVSFVVAPGTITALVGPSGAGKSTVAALIAAFYSPTAGTITIDGADITTVTLDSYRSQLGFVLQDTFLFDGTIRDNVMFGRPTSDDASVRRACRLARVQDFVDALPQGIDTRIGERGVRLSGGQRQRLCIARAILADPSILILDEATSSVDLENEALIQDGLRTLMQGRTSIVIAHRLSTIKHADQILVLEAGQIVARGTHESLSEAGGRYAALCAAQCGVLDRAELADLRAE